MHAKSRMCRRKKRYRDKKEAIRALHHLLGSRREIKPTRAYPCPFCKGYHLTSKEKQ